MGQNSFELNEAYLLKQQSKILLASIAYQDADLFQRVSGITGQIQFSSAKGWTEILKRYRDLLPFSGGRKTTYIGVHLTPVRFYAELVPSAIPFDIQDNF
jgi:hypothetical protein